MASYHNIEKRILVTQYPAAKYRGWNADGEFYYIGKGRARGNLWWAVRRDGDKTPLYGNTMREISEKLTQARKASN